MPIRYPGASERGGLGGPIQPPPHEPTPSEQMRHLYATNPADSESTVEEEYQRELKQVRR